MSFPGGWPGSRGRFAVAAEKARAGLTSRLMTTPSIGARTIVRPSATSASLRAAFFPLRPLRRCRYWPAPFRRPLSPSRLRRPSFPAGRALEAPSRQPISVVPCEGRGAVAARPVWRETELDSLISDARRLYGSECNEACAQALSYWETAIRRRVTCVSSICFRYVGIERGAGPGVRFGSRTDGKETRSTAV